MPIVMRLASVQDACCCWKGRGSEKSTLRDIPFSSLFCLLIAIVCDVEKREEGSLLANGRRPEPEQREPSSPRDGLAPALLSRNHPHLLPGPLRPFRRRFVAIDDAVVLIGFADRT